MVILVALGIYANTYTFRYKRSMTNIAKSSEVVNKANQILSEGQELQNSLKGYIITLDSSYLTSLSFAEQMIRVNMSQILSFDLEKSQRAKIVAINEQISKEIALAKEIIATASDTSGIAFQNARKMIASSGLRGLNINVRYSVNEFINNERHAQNESFQVEERNSNFDKVIFVVTLSIIVSVAILLLSLLYILKTYKRLKSTEKLLMRSQLRLENILDTLPIGIIIANALSKEFHANHKAIELLDGRIGTDGYLDERNTVEGDAGNNLSRELMQTLLIDEALEGEHQIGIHHVMRKKNNAELPLRISATPLYNENNQIEYAISVFDDITNIKIVEKELIEAKRLVEQSLRLKESFLTNMSHEIRTPMNAILGFTELLSRKDLGAEQNEYVRTIRSSSDNLLRLLNDILDFSKLEANMLVFEEQPMAVNDIIHSLCDLLSPKAQSKGVTLSYSLGSDIPDLVLGDSVRLTQILTNILGNAIKFTNHGEVTISTRRVISKDDKVVLEFKVRDTGIGISPEKISSIFNRFEQADTETSRFYGGTGLGLSIAKHLIESQGGVITVESEIDKGSEFVFTIPFKSGATETPSDEAVPAIIDYELIKQQRILLVEDNLFNRKLVEGIFKEYGLGIDMVETGREAIELLKKESYDVILMDIEMPEINGYTTSGIIRQELKLDTPIIALTAHAMAGEREKCLQAGMNDYLSKPVNIKLLFEKICNVSSAKEEKINHISRPLLISDTSEGKKRTEDDRVSKSKYELNYLKEISNGNREFEREMIELLLVQIPEQLKGLRDAYWQKDFIRLKEFAHKLKGLMPIAGWDDMAPYFSSVEAKAADKTITVEDIKTFSIKEYQVQVRLASLTDLLKLEYA